jgi:hypothetical protein
MDFGMRPSRPGRMRTVAEATGCVAREVRSALLLDDAGGAEASEQATIKKAATNERVVGAQRTCEACM